MRYSTCHPNRKVYATNLCQSCYNRKKKLEWKLRHPNLPKKYATCHPDRLLLARGLCSACYHYKRMHGQLTRIYRTVKPQSLCHTERKEYARKLCRSCYNLLIRREWRKRNPNKHYESILKRKYGISFKQYLTMVEKQSGRCAICKQTKINLPAIGGLHVDHCHKTGKTRKLLCLDCNTTLGKLERDGKDVFMSFASYLNWKFP